jgi:hypothetical protein
VDLPSPSRVLSGDRNQTEWNPWWILLWYASTIGWVSYSLWAADFSRGFLAFVVLFLPQEMFALRKSDDAFPPLTHVVRNRFSSWFAFPLIFGTVAAVCSRWAALEWRAVGLITLPVAGLGWLIEHFLATYAGPDPRRGGTEAGPARRAA